ncbi:hypothetical protein PH562_18930 [Rhizobium sp. CNPSo 4062]|uniref:DUF6950 family protein n=1 Tax=Rhizobium sp. CNPSo 4062 TaxID=3021410 RepID=UPI00254B6173|nr:hypothetical protein [Rhizobium sp. CNPSo 4062]MDK4704335.1 hypothetical protein [Rhizobium sp. CNPSo 4062]
MTNIETALRAYVEAAEKQPVVWGESDCSAWAARWVSSFHGRKLIAPHWRSSVEARQLVADAGSLAALWTKVLSEYGLQLRYGAPQAGDVGILETRVSGQVGVIFIHDALVVWRGEPVGARFLRPHPQAIVKVWALI